MKGRFFNQKWVKACIFYCCFKLKEEFQCLQPALWWLDTKVQFSKWVGKTERSNRRVEMERKLLMMRVREKEGGIHQMCSFVLVSGFVGQGVGEHTHRPIPGSQTHSQIKLEVSVHQNASSEKNEALVEKQHKHSLFLLIHSGTSSFCFIPPMSAAFTCAFFSPLFNQWAENTRAALGPTISH